MSGNLPVAFVKYVPVLQHQTNGIREPGSMVFRDAPVRQHDVLLLFLFCVFGDRIPGKRIYRIRDQPPHGFRRHVRNRHKVIADGEFVPAAEILDHHQGVVCHDAVVRIQRIFAFPAAGQDMIQAAVFIKNSVDAATGNAFLEKLQASIEAAIADPTVVESGLSVFKDDEATAQYGFNPTVVVNVFKQKNALGVNAMGLGFKKAIDIKSDIDAFLSIFSINQTSEEIYFK